MTSLADDVRRTLRSFPDFPTRGVLFRDIAPVLADPTLLQRVVDALAHPFDGRVDKVAAIESRGFLLGAPVALRLGAGFVPVRKAGKLPGPTLREAYGLEYGAGVLELQEGALAEDDRVLVVDDVLATGGTAAATASLVERAGASVEGFTFLLDIPELEGRERITGDVRVLLTP